MYILNKSYWQGWTRTNWCWLYFCLYFSPFYLSCLSALCKACGFCRWFFCIFILWGCDLSAGQIPSLGSETSKTQQILEIQFIFFGPCVKSPHRKLNVRVGGNLCFSFPGLYPPFCTEAVPVPFSDFMPKVCLWKLYQITPEPKPAGPPTTALWVTHFSFLLPTGLVMHKVRCGKRTSRVQSSSLIPINPLHCLLFKF